MDEIPRLRVRPDGRCIPKRTAEVDGAPELFQVRELVRQRALYCNGGVLLWLKSSCGTTTPSLRTRTRRT